jgi:hypothetical protein
MSQLTITISDKADALIAQLQKEIFNRRRKKVTAEGVVETLIESGAKSQSDKRFATSWQNLLADIEKAAKVAQTHGSKPSSLSDEEWALVLGHRTRSSSAAESPRSPRSRAAGKAKAISTPARRRSAASLAKAAASAAETIDEAGGTSPKRASRAIKPRTASKGRASTVAGSKPKAAAAKGAGTSSRKRATAAPANVSTPAKPPARSQSRKATTTTSKSSRSSVARRMAKAASRLVSTPSPSIATAVAASQAPSVNGSNGVDTSMLSAPVS